MRVLVLTAAIGAGHDLPAEVLATELRERGHDVEIRDALVMAGRLAERAILGGSTFDTRWGNVLFDVEHRLLHDVALTREAAAHLAMRVVGPPLLAGVAAAAPRVVVSTYPGATEILGRLRARGALHVPVVAAVTDLAALRFWSHPAVSLHVVTQAEAIPEVRRVAGAGTDVVHVRGLDDPRFASPPGRERARAALGLPADLPVVVVSGGGWAVGDLEGAAEEALRLPGAQIVLLAGSEPQRARRLERRFAAEPRVRCLGFCDDMPTLLAAADVLVHSTAGLTVMEALVVGCRVVSYGWGRGHIRANNRAFARHGMARVARSRAELRPALAAALAEPSRPDPAFAALPTAAAEIIRRFG